MSVPHLRWTCKLENRVVDFGDGLKSVRAKQNMNSNDTNQILHPGAQRLSDAGPSQEGLLSLYPNPVLEVVQMMTSPRRSCPFGCAAIHITKDKVTGQWRCYHCGTVYIPPQSEVFP